MDIQRSVVLILVAVNLFAEGKQPRIEVYEIRKRIHESLNGDQYNDKKSISHLRDASYKKNDKFLNDILQKLLRISDRTHVDDDSEREEFEDKARINGLLQRLLRMTDRSYEDDDSEQEEFEDKTRINDLLKILLRMSDRSYEDDDSEQEEFEDKTRSLPTILISDDRVDQRIPQTENTVQKLLQSALQSGFNG